MAQFRKNKDKAFDIAFDKNHVRVTMLSGCQEVVFLDLLWDKNKEEGLLSRRSEKTTAQWIFSYCERTKEQFLCEFRRPEPLQSDEWFEFMSANCVTCSIEKVKVYDI